MQDAELPNSSQTATQVGFDGQWVTSDGVTTDHDS